MHPAFKVWRSVRLGTGLYTASDFYAAFKEKGIKVGGYANDILCDRHFCVSRTETTIQLVNVSVGELWFTEPAKRAEIYLRAEDMGYELCPVEAGAQLRLQYLEQPPGERLTLAMPSILNNDGYPAVFFVAHLHGELRLSGDFGFYDLPYSPEDRFVFACRE